jgi:hypothetical protein
MALTISGVRINGALTAAHIVPPRPLTVGDVYQGGFYAGEISTTGNGVATHRLVIAPKASGQAAYGTKYRTTRSSADTSTQNVIDGPTISAYLDGLGGHPAASFCEALTIGGSSDWYLPAKNELEVCYYNLKRFTTSNDTAEGINANAVPARASNYTASIPAQTSATDFIQGGDQAFDNDYWSSSQSATFQNAAWSIIFTTGSWTQFYKDYAGANVRAVRRVAV